MNEEHYWAFDLTGHEATRVAAVIDALSAEDLERADTNQALAERMLMADLTPEQKTIRETLRDAGVLP